MALSSCIETWSVGCGSDVDEQTKLKALSRWFREAIDADDLLTGRVDGFEIVPARPDGERAIEIARCEAAVPLANAFREPAPRSVEVVARLASALLYDADVQHRALPRLDPIHIEDMPGVVRLVFAMHWKSQSLATYVHGFSQALRLDEVLAVRDDVPHARYVIDAFDARPEGEDGRLEGVVYRVGEVRPAVTVLRIVDLSTIQDIADHTV